MQPPLKGQPTKPKPMVGPPAGEGVGNPGGPPDNDDQRMRGGKAKMKGLRLPAPSVSPVDNAFRKPSPGAGPSAAPPTIPGK